MEFPPAPFLFEINCFGDKDTDTGALAWFPKSSVQFRPSSRCLALNANLNIVLSLFPN